MISEKDAGTYTVTGDAQKALLAAVAVDGQMMMSDPNYSITLNARDSFLKIEALPLTITTPSAEKTYDGTALTKSEGAKIEYSYWTANIGGTWEAATATPGQVTLGTGDKITFNVTGSQTEVGTSDNSYGIIWGDVKSSNYKISATLGTLKVKNGAITITAASQEWTYDGNAHSSSAVTVTAGSLAEGDVLVATAIGSVTNVEDTATGNNPIAEGYKIMRGEVDVTGNYEITPVAGTLTIKAKAVTVTAKSEEFTYDGNAHSNSGYDVDGLVGSDAITAVVEGSITFPSESPVTNKLASYQFTSGKATNYTVTKKDGQLTMKKAEAAITITAASQTWTYDGNAHSNNTVTVTAGELFTGDKLVATATGNVTYVADSTEGNNPVAEGYKILHGTEDVTANYAITVKPGTLTINPVTLTIQITGNNDTKVYDGEEHSVSGYTASNGKTAFDASKVSYSGTATATRTEVGTTNMNLDVGKFSYSDANVTATFQIAKDGFMTITEATTPVPEDPTPEPDEPTPVPDGPIVIPDNPQPVPPAEPTTIDNDPTPRTDPTEPETETIPVDPTPKGKPTKVWALLNLILSIVTVVLGIVMVITFAIGKKDDDEDGDKEHVEKAAGEEDSKKKHRNALKFLGLIPAIGTVILFLLTEDLTAKMVLTDKWTILTAIITVIGLVMTIVIRNKKNKQEEETDENANA